MQNWNTSERKKYKNSMNWTSKKLQTFLLKSRLTLLHRITWFSGERLHMYPLRVFLSRQVERKHIFCSSNIFLLKMADVWKVRVRVTATYRVHRSLRYCVTLMSTCYLVCSVYRWFILLCTNSVTTVTLFTPKCILFFKSCEFYLTQSIMHGCICQAHLSTFCLLLLIKTHFCDAKWKSNSLKNTLYLQCILFFKACGFHLTRPNMHGCICQAHHAYFFKTTIIKKVMPMGNQYTY